MHSQSKSGQSLIQIQPLRIKPGQHRLMGYWPLSTLTGPFQIRERSLWIVTFFLGMTRKAQSAFELNTATRITHPYGLRAGVMR